MNVSIQLRAEVKPGEHRTPLTPADARRLKEAGFDISVESSSMRVFPDADYISAGCELTEAGSWVGCDTATYVLGIKELPEAPDQLRHRHIYFGHAYKEQAGWRELLSRFNEGGGQLLDLEFLTDDNGRRLAAFGYWAGYAGAAMAMKMWIGREQDGNTFNLPVQGAYKDKSELIAELSEGLEAIGDTSTPDPIVIGALGRCGRGATDLFTALGIEPTRWDLEETARGGPFPELNQYDMLVNTVLLSDPIPPFITLDELSRDDRRLGVISDVSCDPTSPGNPLPIYEKETSFTDPVSRIVDGENPVDLTAIDHLPSMLPKESSEDFSSQLLPLLLNLTDNNDVWERCLEHFVRHAAKR